jgi:threonyl-tRNA synthetase
VKSVTFCKGIVPGKEKFDHSPPFIRLQSADEFFALRWRVVFCVLCCMQLKDHTTTIIQLVVQTLCFITSLFSNMKPEEKATIPSSLKCNATSKFAVMDAPGVSQPSSSVKANKEGLQGRRAKASSGPKMDAGLKLGGDSFMKRTKNPDWLNQRMDVYQKIQQRRAEELTKKTPVPITVTLPDGKVISEDKEGNPLQAWKTSPYDVAVTISQGLADAATVARVTYEAYCDDYSPAEDGMEGEDTLSDAMADAGLEKSDSDKTLLWDMTRPLVGRVAKLEFLKFETDQDAKTVFWHSSAHMMGEALEHLYGCKLTIGPPLAGGFYYDSYMGTDAFREEDCKFDRHVTMMYFVCPLFSFIFLVIDKPVEEEVSKIVKQKQQFERMVITKEEGLELFADNPFKQSILKTKVPDNGRTTVYRCGDLIDLCRGPHVVHTGKIKAFAATRHSATNWLGNTDNDTLQRMYGISFPDKKMLKVWQENQEKVGDGWTLLDTTLAMRIQRNLIHGLHYDRKHSSADSSEPCLPSTSICCICAGYDSFLTFFYRY